MFLPFWTIGGLISKATEGYPLDDVLQYLQAKVSHYRCLRFLRQLQAARDTERARFLELLTKLKWERKTRDGGFIIFTILHCMHACMHACSRYKPWEWLYLRDHLESYFCAAITLPSAGTSGPTEPVWGCRRDLLDSWNYKHFDRRAEKVIYPAKYAATLSTTSKHGLLEIDYTDYYLWCFLSHIDCC